MKRILFLIIFFTITFNISAQINSFSRQGIDCYNDTGFIALDANFDSIQWEKLASGVWAPADTFPSVYLNLTGDTLNTTQCGKYRSIVWYNGGISQQIDSFFVSCPVTIGQGQDNILCYGDSSGILKRPVFGGTPFDPNNSILLNDTLDGDEYYIYTWYYAEDATGTGSIVLPDTTENLISIPAGWYKTIVEDAIGCTDTFGYINFGNPPVLIIDTTFIKHIDCRGTSTGSVSFEIGGGKKFNTNNKYFYYLILYGDTVVFSDLTGSSSNFLNSSISLNMQSAFKDSIQIDNLIAGNYVLVVVDSNSCIMTDTFNIVEPLPYATFASTTFPLICESDSGYLKIDSVLGGGNILYGFTGQNTDSIYVASGWHQMYIEDLDFNCIDTVPVRCYAQYEINVYETISNVICSGDTSGIITIDSIVGGNLPYDVQWGGINNNYLAANTYSVIVVDAIGCVHSEVFTVNQPDPIQANAVLYPPSCNGFSNGSITINLSAGTGSLSYYWLNGTGTVDSLYGLTVGIYPLVVLDSLICTDTIEITLSEPDVLAISFTNYQNPLMCNGELTTIDILILGGTGPFDVIWNDGDTAIQRILGAGSYSCDVTDANGCTASEVLEIIEPDSLILNLIYSESSCDDGGIASISINGGVQPISILWSTGETTVSINSLWGTTYWVLVTDSCGNSVSDTIYLNPYLLETSIPPDVVLYPPSLSVSVEIDNSSTGGPFSYEWNSIDINIAPHVGSIHVNGINSGPLCEGKYSVVTIDLSNNCFVVDTFNATFYLPNGIVDSTTTTVFVDADLWGFGPYKYTWYAAPPNLDELTVVPNNEQHANICPGDWWVEVEDINNCIVSKDVSVKDLMITLDPASALLECDVNIMDVSITGLPSGGTPFKTPRDPYDYLWWNGDTLNPIILGMSPGNNRSVTVTDANGCSTDKSFVIKTMTSECIPNVFTPDGNDINDTWSLEDAFLFTDSEIRVYGRYGKLLFQSVGASPWDGKNEKGNDVPDGVYFYSIDIGHGFDAIKGSVTILR